MITKANILAAAASIQMGVGGAVNFEAGCSIARTGTGTYNVLVDETQTVPPSVGGCFAQLDVALSYAGDFDDAGATVTHLGDNFTGTAALPTVAGPNVPPQTLFQVTMGTAFTILQDIPGNLLVQVVAVGGGNPSNPSQTGI